MCPLSSAEAACHAKAHQRSAARSAVHVGAVTRAHIVLTPKLLSAPASFVTRSGMALAGGRRDEQPNVLIGQSVCKRNFCSAVGHGTNPLARESASRQMVRGEGSSRS